MKLTKKSEAEILKVYNRYWKGVLTGDTVSMATCLDSDFQIIGSAEGEVFLNKKGALQFYNATADQIAGKADLRNRKIKYKLIDELIHFTELSDLYILIEKKWEFYSKFYITSLLKKIGNGWKFIRIHASVPDSKTIEGEQLAFDKIKKENLKLKEAVKRRTVELEEKNHDLEIETALEKIRAVAMGMTKPGDLLDVCKHLFKQFLLLGFNEMRNVMINIHNDKEKSFINYDYSDELGKSTNHLTYNIHPLITKQVKKIRRANDAFSETYFTGKDLVEWKKFRRRIGEKDDPRIARSKGLFYYFYSTGIGSIGISTFGSISEEKKALLKRFRNVFALSYQRYVDIAKAVAQTREAEIELALERVRARTMSMHKSEELASVASVLFHQLQELNLPSLRRCLIGIVDEKNKRLQSWHTSLVGDSTHKVLNYPINEHPVIRAKIRGWRKKKPFSIDLPSRELKDFIKYIVKHGFEYSKGETPATKLIQNHAPFKFGYLEVATHEPIPKEDFQLLQRFAKVFEQTYTRFLDLQKAEAQAREAQVQLSLERVRARTMAMQHSNELSEIAVTMHKELVNLGVTPFLNCGYVEIDEKNKIQQGWSTQPDGTLMEPYRLPLAGEQALQDRYDAWKRKETVFCQVLNGKDLRRHIAFASPHLGSQQVNEMVKKFFPKPTIFYCANFSHGYLSIITGIQMSEEEVILLTRFRKEFEQSYARFLDLKKAEAQAREAEIQLALERVRARTMAMHKSDELAETAQLLYEQFRYFCGDLIQMTILIANEKDKLFDCSVTDWAGGGKAVHSNFQLSFDEPALISHLYTSWKKKEKSCIIQLEGKRLQQWIRHRNKATGVPVPTEKRTVHSANFSKGCIAFSSSDTKDQTILKLLERFASVLDLTYTRFLDLQKAEAQARESQIQLALERVRARTMAMQKSEELPETSVLIFQQMKELGKTAVQNSIGIINEEEGFVELSTTVQGHLEPRTFHVPIDDPHVMARAVAAWKAKQKSLTIEFRGKELIEYNKLRNSYFETKVNFPEDRWVVNIIFFSKGWLSFSANKDISAESIDQLKRFAAVFEQTYTRFLDLKRAEAQARESQIEVSLERVRARAMAMQKSDELREAATVLYRELRTLGLNNFINCGYVLIDEKNNVQNAWMTHRDGTIREAHQMPLTGDEIMDERYEMWKKNVRIFHQTVGGERLRLHNDFTTGQSVSKEEPKNMLIDLPDPTVFYCGNFSEGYLHLLAEQEFSAESEAILSRFTSVFEITFRRFLDLQKAEAQAREAQIETALERVRSRSMAMQNSNELAELVATVFRELTRLDFDLTSCIIWIHDHAKDTLWIASPEINKPAQPYYITAFHDDFFRSVIHAWKAKDKKWVYALTGIKKKNFEKAFFKEVPHLPEALKKGLKTPEQVVFSASFSNFGALELVRKEPLTEEQFSLLHRFGKVFDQTYTRFLDLKQAEAQAREAEIELALERVRARTMAMHHSSELTEAGNMVFQQIKQLGINVETSWFWFINRDSDTIEIWATHENKLAKPIRVKGADFITFQQELDAWKNKEPFVKLSIPKQAAKKTLRNIFGIELNDYSEATTFHLLQTYHKYGFLGISTWQEATEEEMKICTRFAKVFEQTYTRFLDLQKAEAQARESEIQLALERVRARAMAMQSSGELKDLISTVFAELTKLDLVLTRCLIMIFDPETKGSTWWMANSEDPSNPNGFYVKYHEQPPYLAYIKAWQERQLKWNYVLQGTEKKEWDDFLFSETELSHLPDQVISGMRAPEKVYLTGSFNNFGNLNLASLEPLSNEHFDILLRFAKVFELSYTRFNDIQKAETQAREAKIEAGLERVRARTMAMHTSDELADAASVLFQELKKLGIEHTRSGVAIIDYDNDTVELWLVTEIDGKAERKILGHVTASMHSLYQNWIEAGRQKKPYFFQEMEDDELKNYYETVSQFWQVPVPTEFNHSEAFYGFFFPEGTINVIALEKLSEEQCNVILRFAKVFGQTYRRYLDLQKAEAQARESQIQLALERVRARTMAMQQSDELGEAASLLFKQVNDLGIETWTSGFNIWEKDDTSFIGYNPTPTGGITAPYHIPSTEDHFFKKIYETKKRGEDFLVFDWKGESLAKTYRYMKTLPIVKDVLKTIEEAGFQLPTFQINHCSFFSHGFLLFITLKPHPEAHDIFKRFGKVFEQTYTRFLDLKKAEAQAREAKIEASLEKVRSSAMAMHDSRDISSTTTIAFEELQKLNIRSKRCGVAILSDDSYSGNIYAAATSADGKFHTLQRIIDMTLHPSLTQQYDSWKKQENYIVEMKGEELKAYYQLPFFYSSPEYVPPTNYDRSEYGYYIPFSEGLFYAWTEEPYSEEEINILNRFKKIVDLTFRRFFDLQKAEAQARESQIEAALERVRSKAMSMHSSKDLSDTVNVFFKELKTLGITPLRCGVGEIDEQQRISSVSATTASKQGDSYEVIGKLKLEEHPILDAIFDHWKKQQEYYPVLKGAEIKPYYEAMNPQVHFPDFPDHEAQYGSYFYFKEGLVYAWTEKELAEDEIKIFRRFTSVISLTYRRYVELQQSETNAKEAIKQAALDRIRADIASMRTVNDLNRITPLMWNELTILGIPFIRCGVFIMDNEQKLIHTFLSTPDGKAIAAFHIPYDTPGKIRLIPENWRKKTIYLDHWDDSDFVDFANTLLQQKIIDSTDQYLSTIPHGGFYLHFLPFLQGMLYVGNTFQLGNEDIILLQHVADAFSTAYARYEDFNKLEAAKKQVDKTLTDLRQAQQQLVQSEKMASLGEMTAGIAHEIQNPLNFVNNFSDVSTELLQEMKAELEKGNAEDVKAIADDVIQNLEKILFHGKRADGIVKSMLQHSRASSGKKEPTDLNALADEYLRLSFHGLRAKDKSFNAKFETEFDRSIGKVNILSQDIGRVILNLINNAFYAVTEKKKQSADGYEPFVKVTTKKIDDKIELRVIDNGGGIPQKVLDKIFQPFFTTKPTGQGTGLGLSLAYDIITKGHGGEIKVETNEGEGTAFIIRLPAI